MTLHVSHRNARSVYIAERISGQRGLPTNLSEVERQRNPGMFFLLIGGAWAIGIAGAFFLEWQQGGLRPRRG